MLKGSLDGFPLPDLFRLLSRSKKTGRLDVKRRAGRGQVYFRDGEIYFALTSLSKVPLGQKLIASGVVTEGQLMQALDRNAETGERVGEILVSTEVITIEQLEAAVRSQSEDAIFDLLKWEVGDFSWEPGVSIAVEVALGLSVEELLMEASRRLDELEIIQRKVPSATAVMKLATTAPEGATNISITSDEWRILTLVDGSRTIGEIARLVGVEEIAAMKVFHALMAAGLIEVASYAPSAAAPAVAGAPDIEPAAAPPPRQPEPSPAAS
ncbi:MAG: DUF4388 domain-containing protein, partial [Actinobacteria bacterium]|nr:DUF4388 domain-containing protein [Actinomycetota bacterium]